MHLKSAFSIISSSQRGYTASISSCALSLNLMAYMNVNADYLYGELEKRNIPAVVMEPLLGGRLSNIPEHIFTRLKERNPEGSVASWAFRFAGSFDKVLTVLSGMDRRNFIKTAVVAPGLLLNLPSFAESLYNAESQKFPLIDLHAHLTDTFTIEKLLELGEKYNVKFGVVDHPAP